MFDRKLIILAMAALASIATVALAEDDLLVTNAATKTFITDGSVVHTTNDLWNNVTNWGLIGSRPTMPSPFSHAPSARWPGASGTDYLWAAGFWVGGVVLGERLVSTGQFASEITATAAPEDIIYATAHGAPGGTRYPWPGADDDADGREDEDPLDGRDNDGDGLVDEDFAAAGEREYRCAMWDTTALAQENYPDHTPLGIAVVQRSFQWTDPAAVDFIGYEYAVTNIGVATIDDLHGAMFSDFDIDSPEDDTVGSWVGLVAGADGSFIPVSLAWMRDAAVSGAVPGYAAWVMCGVVTDAAAGPPADPLAMFSFNRFSGNAPFEQGGDPTNDSERYELLSTPEHDPDALPGRVADYRMVVSTPRIAALAPGETATYRFALVMGGDFDALIAAAAQAVVTARGVDYDRDGDPANGAEYNVPWLRPEDAPVPALTGRLVPAPVAGGVDLAFDVRRGAGLTVAVVRQPRTGLASRRWDELAAAGTISDRDAGPWPRTYDLVAKAAGGDVVLDTAEVAGPAAVPLALRGSPNPFNPRLTLEFTLPEAGWARLAVHDLRGRVVRELFAESRRAGADHVVWDGLDATGRAAASGVYTVRLETSAGAAEQRVTLVR